MDVTRWRLGDVAERLLGGRKRWDPPPDWACWSEPAPVLPIDRAITALRHSNRVPQLRPEEVLDARIIACPYYAARYATAMAVDAATVAAGDDPADMARRWRAHEHAARDARASIAAIAQSLVLAAEVPCTRWPLLEPDEVTRAYELVVMVHRIGGLDRIAEYARQSRQLFQNNQGDAGNVWRVVFAADLAFTWRVLTGSNPARTDPFVGFVAAAFESLTDDPSPEPWENAVRRALAMELDWDRYDKKFSGK